MTRNENMIAFKGKVTLEKAVWDNISGMTVVFALEQRPHELNAANPFKKFTKMRKGKVGTRFDTVVVTQDETTIVYDDELMLKGWNDGTTGWKVTFWLQGEDNEHPFMIFDKDAEFMMAAVELDDDNTAIDQVKRDRVETAVKHRKQGLSNFAALLCRTPDFWSWLAITQKVEGLGGEYPSPDAELLSKKWMCEKLTIESRAELDSNPVVAGQFHAHIRRPYSEWMEQR